MLGSASLLLLPPPSINGHRLSPVLRLICNIGAK
jgi:hypothetical protein